MMKIKLKNTKTISAIGFLILIAVIWFVGPFVGWSITDCLYMILGVLALWLFTLLVGRVLAVRAGRLIEKMLRSQADKEVVHADAARRIEVKLLRDRLLSAITTLKTSKLGKKRGSAALYELPWYMIIGHPAAGKSTALINSGLTFPFEDSGIQGIGGTRNCDWFFSTEGVLLDTAGRYATQLEDRAEWIDFLKLLKRYRRRAPINGILVATSLPELVNHNTEDFTAYVHKIRERIHEIEDIFELRVPVYLVITKLDLLGGFTQFFEGLDENERSRVWGATLPHEQDESFEARREAERQCELLYRGIKQIGEEKLGLSLDSGGKPALYAFPLEFHSLKDGVSRLVGLLYEDDPYHAKPLLRGIYFTSALQSGEPRIAAAERVSAQFDLIRPGFALSKSQGTNSYFLRDLFREVLFSDQGLVMRQTQPGVSRLRLAGMMAGVTVLTISLSVLARSYMNNSDMLTAIGKERATSIELLASESLNDKLKGLTVLQKRLEELDHYYEHHAPLRLSAGLYQGKRVRKALRKQYFDGLRTVMLNPLQNSLETALKQIKAESDSTTKKEGYITLKTYLMLADRPRMDAPFLNEQMPHHWHPWLATQRGSSNMEEIEANANSLLKYYLSQVKVQANDLPLIETNLNTVETARVAIRTQSPGDADVTPAGAIQLVYEEIIKNANARFPALTVARILEGRDGNVITGSETVPGALTSDAWKNYVRDEIDKASRGEIKGDDWVLAIAARAESAIGGDTNKNRAELLAKYRGAYADAWNDFLDGISIAANPGDTTQATRMLERLADANNSPLKIVLQRAARETSWDNPGQIAQSVSGAQQNLSKKTSVLLGTGSPTTPPKAQQNMRYGELGKQFAALNRISDIDSQASPILAGYLGHLSALRGQLAPIASNSAPAPAAQRLMLATLNGSGSEFANTLQYIDGTMLAGIEDDDEREVLRQLFARPLFLSYTTLLPPVEEAINEAWQSEVYGQWQNLADKYPFNKNAQSEARTGEITRFIGPGGTIEKFISDNLNDLLVKRGGQFVPREWANLGIRFNPSFLERLARMIAMGKALEGSGGDTSRFDLRPVPTAGLTDITIEIDGQILIYRMGPQQWQSFTWPGASSEGARIEVTAFDGTTSTISKHPGRMGMMRMFGESARSLGESMTSGQLEWRFRGRDGSKSVKLDFRMSSGLNPMLFTSLSQGDLPRRITH